MLLIPTCTKDLQDAVWEEGLKQHQQSNPPQTTECLVPRCLTNGTAAFHDWCNFHPEATRYL